MKQHTVEKIGGTSMSDYAAIRDNIVKHPSMEDNYYNRVFVVSAYGGITNLLLEHKKSGQPGVYGLFASGQNDDSWQKALHALRDDLFTINADLFAEDALLLQKANDFIGQRLEDTEKCLADLQNLCQHGHFSLEGHLLTVREMLASLGEAHSAWNTAQLLQRDGVNACFIDLTGWNTEEHLAMDERISLAFADVDYATQLPIVTGYTHADDGLMAQFDRGYSEMTFSRIAVITDAKEAIIHKEYHLSSADPKMVGEGKAVPIGRTNYDVADQLANLGMEAIHPKAASGLRISEIPLRIKNTFEPDHKGTLITGDYISDTPRAEIIAGCKGVYAIEVFDQNMMGSISEFDQAIVNVINNFKAQIITKDVNANTITHYLAINLKNIKRIEETLAAAHPGAEVTIRRVAIVSAIGSDMQIPGILAQTVGALAAEEINVLAMHQSMRQVDMQFVIDEKDYNLAIKSLHACLVEVHDHGAAICAA